MHVSFVYPKLLQYPIDELAARILKALELQNEEPAMVRGLHLTYAIYGQTNATLDGKDHPILRYDSVATIGGDAFDLRFSNEPEVGRGRAELLRVDIPQKQLLIGVGGSLELCTYAGHDWAREDALFRAHPKQDDSKANHTRRLFWKYRVPAGTVDFQCTEDSSRRIPVGSIMDEFVRFITARLAELGIPI